MIVKQWLKEIIHEMWNSRDLRSPVFIWFDCASHQVTMANGKLEHNDDISLSVHILHFIIILFRKFNMKTKCWPDDMYWDNSRIKLKPGRVKVSRLKFKSGKNNYNCRPGSVKLGLREAEMLIQNMIWPLMQSWENDLWFVGDWTNSMLSQPWNSFWISTHLFPFPHSFVKITTRPRE